jgi:hypothetical protein
MANEIKVTVRRSTANGTYKNEKNPGTVQIDQAALGEGGGLINIGTSEETVAFAEVGTNGWLFMQNHDTANYVLWGPSDGTNMVEMGRLEAGEPAVLRADPGMVLIMKADTATCEVEVSMLED